MALSVVATASWASPGLAQNLMEGQGFQAQAGFGGGNPNAVGGPAGANQRTNPAAIRDWFSKYDMVRRQAQMTPNERAKADDLMSKGLQMFVPGEEKIEARNLLTNLVGKYDRACNQLKQLPYYPETAGLHRQYFKYFSDAKKLFSDYLVVQSNPMAKDANGNSVFASIMQRKGDLEGTEMQAKNMDAEVRNRFGIGPYRY